MNVPLLSNLGIAVCMPAGSNNRSRRNASMPSRSMATGGAAGAGIHAGVGRTSCMSPPTKPAPTMSPAELADLRAGIALFDQGKTQEAIAKFEEILKAHPDSPIALYELGMSYRVAGQYQRAIDALAAAAAYDVPKPQLARSYGMIGNTLDMAREPRKGDRGLCQGPRDRAVSPAVLQHGRDLRAEPRRRAERESGAQRRAAASPWHASTQLQLGRLFLMDKLLTPSLLAFSRFLIIEPASARKGDINLVQPSERWAQTQRRWEGGDHQHQSQHQEG